MDFFNTFRRRLIIRLLVTLLIVDSAAYATGWWLSRNYTDDDLVILSASALVLLVGTLLALSKIARESTRPLQTIWQAIQHVAPEGESQPAPDVNKLGVGRELVANITNHVYQLASVVDGVEATNYRKAQDLHTNFVANSLPLPFIVIDKSDTIIFANETASSYFGIPADELIASNLYTSLDMSFASNHTLHAWLGRVRQKNVTAQTHWDRVRVGLLGQKDTRQFDLAAHYNRENTMGYETMLVFFDHTEVYSQDDQAMSFVALTVHELRTPLTLLRGYIEVFDEELGPTLTPELQAFMQKMDAAAQQLSAFVDNILNVAKIEDNQLTLQLHKESWSDIITTVTNDLQLRSSVRGITLTASVPPNLPAVAVDRYSIYEVLANLLDNAIKYSRGAKEIHITIGIDTDGYVETSIQDFGVGIDSAILPHIFDKFYRNHRNRAQIGGTGLGLYLSRAIVQAHGGKIIVRSKPGEGSTFTFTVLPYDKLDEKQKSANPGGISRSAHGWIKNHSMYRD